MCENRLMDNKLSKRARFERVAGSRVQGILDKLDSLSNCSNRNNYEYSEQDVRKMFSIIKERVRIVENSYTEKINKQIKQKFEF